MYFPTTQNSQGTIGQKTSLPPWFDPQKSLEEILKKANKEEQQIVKKQENKIIHLSKKIHPKNIVSLYALQRYNQSKTNETLFNDIEKLSNQHSKFVNASYDIMNPQKQHIGKIRLEFYFLLLDTMKYKYTKRTQNSHNKNPLIHTTKNHWCKNSTDFYNSERIRQAKRYEDALHNMKTDDEPEVILKPKNFGYQELKIHNIFPSKVLIR